MFRKENWNVRDPLSNWWWIDTAGLALFLGGAVCAGLVAFATHNRWWLVPAGVFAILEGLTVFHNIWLWLLDRD